MKLKALVLACLLSAFALPASAAIFFDNDFEHASNTPAGNGCNVIFGDDNTTPTSMWISTDYALTGTRSIKQFYTNVNGSTEQPKCDLSFTASTHVFLRFAYRRSSGFQQGSNGKTKIIRMSGPGYPLVWVYGSYGGLYGLDMEGPYASSNNDNVIVGTAVPVSSSGLDQVELEVQLNTPGQANGYMNLWVNGVLAGTHTGGQYIGPTPSSIGVLGTSNPSTYAFNYVRMFTQSGLGFTYTDRVAVGNTRIGCITGVTSNCGTSSDTAPPSTPSAGPTLTASSSGTISLAFTPPTDTGGSGLQGQNIQYCAGAACTNWTTVSVGPTATTYIITGVSASTLYRARYNGFDNVGNQGTYSAITETTTPAALQRTTLATDDFERADTTVVHNLGATWDNGYVDNNAGAVTDDPFKIVSGRVLCVTLSKDCSETYNGVVTPNDQWASIPVSIWSVTNTYPGLVARWSNVPTKSGYSCRAFSPGTSTVIHEWTAGVVANLATTTSYTWTNGDTMRMEVQGTAIKCYAERNGVETLVVSATDASFASGKTGIIGYVTSALTDMQYGSFAMGGYGPVTPPTIATIDTTARTSVTLTCGAVCPTSVRFVTGNGETVVSLQQWSALPSGVFTYSGAFLAGLTDYIGAYPRDAAGVENTAGVIYDTVTPVPTDTTAPVLTTAFPLISLPADTTSTVVVVSSSEPATVKYAETDIAFSAMTANATATAGGLTHTFTASGLTNGSSTPYCVKGADALLNTNSTCFTITIDVAESTADTTPPTTVTNLVATAISSSEITLSHTASTDAGGAVTYHAYLSSDATNYTLAKIYTGTSATLDGLLPNTAYSIKVLSHDPSLNPAAAYSNVATVTTPPLIDLVAPTAMSELAVAFVLQQSAFLTWTKGTDNFSAVTSIIEQCTVTGDDPCTTFAVVRANIVDPYINLQASLTASTKYCWRGMSADETGNVATSYSATVCATTTASGVGITYPRTSVPFDTDRGISGDRAAGARTVRP